MPTDDDGRGGVLGGDFAQIVGTVALPPRDAEELRVRDVRVHVSVIKVAGDGEPILTTSFAWVSREQRRPVAELDQGE